MNLSVSLLDPVLYTAQRTFYRSPFLFTVSEYSNNDVCGFMLLIMDVIVCAIASRYFTERPIYATMMQYAQLAAGTALISGNKNVEMCQAYLLLSVYPLPARKWEDQRTWLYLGLAVRFFNFFFIMRYWHLILTIGVERPLTSTSIYQ